MFLTAATTLGAIVWLVIWALTGHAFVALIPFIVIVLTAATIKVLLEYLPSQRQ